MGGMGEMTKPPTEREARDRTLESFEEIKRPDAGPRMASATGTRSVIGLQDLRQRIYATAKAEPEKRFWGLFVHVCKLETLRTAYKDAKKNNGAPGIDGVTFDDIEKAGVEAFLERIRDELVSGQYMPLRNRRKEIPKANGKVRVLGIPSIRDRVVQGATKLILEPIFEADFQDGSYGYRPGRSAHDALHRVAVAIAEGKTKVIDMDLKAFFDNVRHHILLAKIATRVDDDKIMRLLKLLLKAGGKRGVPQGGVISPLLANIYLNELDKALEGLRRKATYKTYILAQYARFADDLVVLVHYHDVNKWVVQDVTRTIEEELGKIEVEVNKEKSRMVDLGKGESFDFLGFKFRQVMSHNGRWRPDMQPTVKSRKKLTEKVSAICEQSRSQPVIKLVSEINPVIRGWVNYSRIGNSARCFGYVREWVERKVRRHMMRARQRKGFGWKKWSSDWMYGQLGLYDNYAIRYYRESLPFDRSHNPWQRNCLESPVPETGPPGSLWRGMETWG
jgi:RNA-directed DNA polymerase